MTRFALALALLLLAGCASSPENLSPDKAPDVGGLTSSAKAQLAAGNAEAAVDIFAKVLAADPKNNEARLGFAESALRVGKASDACRAYATLESVPDYADRAHRGKAAAQFASGDADGALATLRAAVGDSPSAETWRALARLNEARQDWGAAEAAYQSALRLAPTGAAYNDYGAALLARRQYEAARQAFVHALEAEPALVEAQNNLRIVYAWEGRYDTALQDVPPAQRPQVLNNVGYIAMQRGDTENARRFLSEALRSSPTFYKRAADNMAALQRGAATTP